jgi:hypothetical protein
LPLEDASWEDYELLERHYPQFILEDKNAFKDRGMSGLEEEVIIAQSEEAVRRERDETDEG